MDIEWAPQVQYQLNLKEMGETRSFSPGFDLQGGDVPHAGKLLGQEAAAQVRFDHCRGRDHEYVRKYFNNHVSQIDCFRILSIGRGINMRGLVWHANLMPSC